jgi:hypothetical protein
MFSLQQNLRKRGRTGSAWKWGKGETEMAQTMYTCLRKCKNDKIKKNKFLIFFLKKKYFTL